MRSYTVHLIQCNPNKYQNKWERNIVHRFYLFTKTFMTCLLHKPQRLVTQNKECFTQKDIVKMTQNGLYYLYCRNVFSQNVFSRNSHPWVHLSYANSYRIQTCSSVWDNSVQCPTFTFTRRHFAVAFFLSGF